jgi:uncharacterized protein DUF1553/uncharacterized protein DUF1549
VVRQTVRVQVGSWTPWSLVAAAALLAAAAAQAEFTPTQKSHWAWKKPARPPVPKVKKLSWVRSPVDAFILVKLEQRGLQPAPAATREELIRRLAFDLTGLPPTPEEIDSFLADASPNAYEKIVDHYLASPAYGERWARHWLDLARYADTNGYEHDEVRPDAWRYRDYVVRSLNADKPYNRFIEEQLAGDEIAPGDADARIATGFNLLGPDMTDAANQAVRRQITLSDMTDTAGLVFLGLTLGCARCHDHKYEPITQKDYYRVQAFFSPAKFRKDIPVGTPEVLAQHGRVVAVYEKEVRTLRDQIDAIAGSARAELREQRIAALPEDVQTAFRTSEKQRTPAQQTLVDRHSPAVEPPVREVAGKVPGSLRERYEALAKDLRALELKKPSPPTCLGLQEDGPESPKTFLLERGELHARGAEIIPGVPTILGSGPAVLPAPPGATSTGRRTLLAKWIASRDNPLTARVMVNRVWQHHFGRGIVPTPSDFGVRGESATHPELLDWLASYFVAGAGGQRSGVGEKAVSSPSPRGAWSLKSLHRLILTSSAYRQSTRAPAATRAADPENELFSRMNRRRLEAEAVRDAALAVAGRLNRMMGGPGVFPPIPEEARPGKNVWPVSANPEDHTRRSLYIFVRRNLNYPALEVLDSPDSNQSCPRREVTTTAPQALALLNSPEMLENARHFARRLLKEAREEEARIIYAYRLALGRKPSPSELQIAIEFLEKQTGQLRGRPAGQLVLPKELPEGTDPYASAALTDYCLALMNLNEFVYID